MPSNTCLRVLVSAGLASAFFALASFAAAQSTSPAPSELSCPPGNTPKVISQKDLPLIFDKSSAGELNYWNSIKEAGEAPAFLAYILTFPKGMYVDPAIEKFRAKCGNITDIPAALLTCQLTSELQDKCHAAKRVRLLNNSPQIQVSASPNAQTDLAYWNSIKESDDPNNFLVYLNHFPQGMFFDAAVENYKRNCGDLGVLPLAALTCAVGAAPVPPPKAKLPPPKVIPPPVIKPPRTRRPPKIIINPCSGTTFSNIISCSGTPPGSPPWTGGTGGNTGGNGRTTPPGTKPITPPPRPNPNGSTTTTPVPVVPPVAPPAIP